MTDVPPFIWPLISLFASGLGGWIGVRIAVTRLETQMVRVIADVDRHSRELGRHAEDLTIHDMELEQVLNHLDMKRAPRQRLRGWDTR